MKSLLVTSVALLSLVITACMAGEPAQTGDPQQQAEGPTSVSEDQSSDALTIGPKACFIEGFCPGSPVAGHPSYCVHTRPCAAGEAIALAEAFCRNHCGGDCSAGNIIQLSDCP